MRERRMLELAFHRHQLHPPGNAASMRIHKADPRKGCDLFGHFGCQLEIKNKIQLLVGWENIFIGIRGGQVQPDCQGMQHMPGDAIILAVRVAVPDHQCLIQALPAVTGALNVVFQFINGALVILGDSAYHVTN